MTTNNLGNGGVVTIVDPVMYLLQGHEIRWLDIGHQLSRVLLGGADYQQAESISTRLSQSLEELAASGYPVDTLLEEKRILELSERVQAEQRQKEAQEAAAKKHAEKAEAPKTGVPAKSAAAKKSDKDAPSTAVSSTTTTPNKTTSSSKDPNEEKKEVKDWNKNGAGTRTRVSDEGGDQATSIRDFAENAAGKDNELEKLVRAVAKYTGEQFIEHGGHSNITEINHICEVVPDTKMTRYDKTYSGLQLYVDHSVSTDITGIDKHAEAFAKLLLGIQNFMGIPKSSPFNMYLDTTGNKIAFNAGGSCFFNLRYVILSHNLLIFYT
jgi:hypothetical protein